MIESAADQLGMLEDFGVTVTCGANSFIAIFDDHFAMVDDLSLNIESSQPQLLCRTSDCVAYGIADGVSLTFSGLPYTVTTREDDGTGFTVLTLHK
ncbi:MAG: hypothetical protein KGL39_34760 [Patescibacteria group bacterium]|nr:hypothetical protein [Patescibacteria group bacterium]